MTANPTRPKARLPRGLADRSAADIRATERMLARIKRVYERYGFEPVETPLIEYTDALGKFLPDLDRPNEGVFSFQDDDEQWLSLRYDLTAPLARYVAENYERLPKPYRSYRQGWVFRNEKPGPGRFRQFMQFDADTVGASSPAADAEMCMMAADALEELGIKRGQYVIKVNSRKVLDGVMEAIGVTDEKQKLTVLRAIDKLDRLGIEGVRELLGPGRKDESGDFTKGAGLYSQLVDQVIYYLLPIEQASSMLESGRVSLNKPTSQITNRNRNHQILDTFGMISLEGTPSALKNGFSELRSIADMLDAAGYGFDRIRIDLSVVRGLEYYTGAVFEAELTFEVKDDDGRPVRFGSVGGGGRYDGLVGRFMDKDVPATGFSIGVSRLQAALKALRESEDDENGPVVVLVMQDQPVADAQRLVQMIRDARLAYPDGMAIGAELYLGGARMKGQVKYADRRNAPLVLIQGENEKSRGVVQIKDMREGKKIAKQIASHEAWREQRPGQEEVAESELVEKVRAMLGLGERRP